MKVESSCDVVFRGNPVKPGRSFPDYDRMKTIDSQVSILVTYIMIKLFLEIPINIYSNAQGSCMLRFFHISTQQTFSSSVLQYSNF